MSLQVRNTRMRDGAQVWKTVDEYNSTYWSGLDARIYANDVFLDEIVTLQYELQEATLPLFSYADYTYRDVAHGSRRVTGAFVINFKRSGYLFDLLTQLEKGTTFPAASTGDPTDRAFQLAAAGNATVEDFIALTSTGKTQAGGRRRLDPKLVTDTITAFRAAVSKTAPQSGKPKTPSATEQAAAQYLAGNKPRYDLGRDFNLRISFGSNRRDAEPAAVRQAFQNGSFHNVPYSGEVHTESQLVGVEITGVSQLIDDSGRPILESYAYIARDVF